MLGRSRLRSKLKEITYRERRYSTNEFTILICSNKEIRLQALRDRCLTRDLEQWRTTALAGDAPLPSSQQVFGARLDLPQQESGRLQVDVQRWKRLHPVVRAVSAWMVRCPWN
jgi:hypothetical protein